MPTKLFLAVLIGSVAYCAPATSKMAASPKSDAAFLATVAQADMTIVHIAKMAQDRGDTAKLKDFANALVQDHTNGYQELTELAAKAGETVPKAIDKQNERTIEALNQYKGKNFDHAFLEDQSAQHERLINAFKHEAEHGSNPDIKAYASKTLPALEQHLHNAQDMLKQKS